VKKPEPADQAKCREKELHIKALSSNIPAMLVSIDKDLHIKHTNNAFQEMLGKPGSRPRYYPDTLPSIVSAQDRKKCSAWLKEVFSDTKKLPSEKEFTIILDQGPVLYCLFRAYFMSFQKDAGPAKRLHIMIIDQTDRVLLKQCAVRDEKLKNIGAIATEVAHEIKNTITAIGGFARRLRKTMPDNVDLQIIEAESTRLERLARSINTYVRPGQKHGQKQPVKQILEQSLYLMTPVLKSKNIKVYSDIGEIPVQFKSDADILSTVFVNLIRNATEALGQGGILKIRCRWSNDQLQIEFENRMEKKGVADQQMLFKSIEQGGRSIGLPLSYRMVRDLGGNLAFSQNNGSAIFKITLPGI